MDPLDRPIPRQNPIERLRAWVAWFGLGRLLAVGASIVVVALGSIWLMRTGPPPTEAGLPMVQRSTAGASTSTSVPPLRSAADAATSSIDAKVVVVHVSGQVINPGVFSLPSGSRVVDAIRAAGGTTPAAVLDQINLAVVVADGSKVHVPGPGETPAIIGTAPAPTAVTGPVNLNNATIDQLDGLPGVGPATAQAIIAYREQHGPFATVESLAEVRGIGPAKLDSLRPLVTV